MVTPPSTINDTSTPAATPPTTVVSVSRVTNECMSEPISRHIQEKQCAHDDSGQQQAGAIQAFVNAMLVMVVAAAHANAKHTKSVISAPPVDESKGQ